MSTTISIVINKILVWSNIGWYIVCWVLQTQNSSFNEINKINIDWAKNVKTCWYTSSRIFF